MRAAYIFILCALRKHAINNLHRRRYSRNPKYTCAFAQTERNKLMAICALICKLFIVSSLISACGFHLRGNLHLPQSVMPIAVVAQNGHTPLEKQLENKLSLQNVDVTDNPAKAKYLIIIIQESMRQDIAAVAASTAPRQYQLTYKVVFKLQKAKGNEPLTDEPMTVTVDRLLTINNDRILGSDSEAALLKKEMQADVATQILARLANSLYIDK